MREVEVEGMPGSIITGVQVCCVQHNQHHLCVSSQAQGMLSCMEVDDAVASQTVVADMLAGMQVQKPGKASRLYLYLPNADVKAGLPSSARHPPADMPCILQSADDSVHVLPQTSEVIVVRSDRVAS